MTSERCQRIRAVVRGNFDVSASFYEQFETSYGLFANLTQRLGRLSGVQPGGRVLDVGCGTGDSCAVLASLVGEGGLVVGMDTSLAMLRLAAARPAPPGAAPVLLVQADGTQPSLLASASFDAVLYNASAFLLPDPECSFRQAAAMLGPGGTVGVSVLEGLVDARTGEDLLARYRGEPALGLRDGRIVTPEALVSMLEAEAGPITSVRLLRPPGTGEAHGFYSIPAQSAALFPRVPVAERMQGVERLFARIHEDGVEPVLAWSLHVGGGSRP